MALCGCGNRISCTATAVVAALVIGVVTAFLRITATITVTPVFLWVVFGIAVGYLAITLLAAALAPQGTACGAVALSALLVGILGTILVSVILLAIEFVATSVIGAIVTGTLLFFFSLMITATACYVKRRANCDD